ncbi:hypothetical protein AB0C38_09985 [Amycolatopsis sp. NPDC048633]|uniref:hypothetical protein n=1 Tax=Amycolatopsis sp. NPDC048633 TaxID=3157095 RepID=UPI0033EE3518
MGTHDLEPSTLDGPALGDSLRASLTRNVALPNPETADAIVLWIAATHAQPAWAHAPRLVVRAPEKSRLLDLVEATCHTPFITVNSSPAAVYRSMSEDPLTLLVDEADTIFGPRAEGNEDLRGLLNAGHQRNRPAKVRNLLSEVEAQRISSGPMLVAFVAVMYYAALRPEEAAHSRIERLSTGGGARGRVGVEGRRRPDTAGPNEISPRPDNAWSGAGFC